MVFSWVVDERVGAKFARRLGVVAKTVRGDCNGACGDWQIFVRGVMHLCDNGVHGITPKSL